MALIETFAMSDDEKNITDLISHMRHYLQPAEKYGFCATCAHINIIIIYLDSFKQCQGDRLNAVQHITCFE